LPALAQAVAREVTMRRSRFVAGVLIGMVVGVGIALAGRKVVDPGLFVGAPPPQAASALLKLAREQAGNGSWERIAVARFLILGGRRDECQAIIDEVLAGKPEASDWVRIGRVYVEAGDWDRAKDMFAKVVEAKPKDADWLAEIGAYYNLKGDRAKAEELFVRSFEADPENYKNLAAAGGSYLGVTPGR
jgi:tetratricopeptide (TPR) repeat protein